MTDTNHNDSNHAASPDDQFPTDESSAHRFVPGETGVGKTTRLAPWFHDQHADELTMTVFDPHGDVTLSFEEDRDS